MPGKVVLLNILGEKIHVRKSTLDLSVAISCLSGEFDIIKFGAVLDNPIMGYQRDYEKE